jgi:hypothetical protein
MPGDSGDSLNGILYLAYYIHIKRQQDGGDDTGANVVDAYHYCQKIVDHGNFSAGIEKTYKEDRASHDDMTGITSLFNTNIIGKINPWPYIYRPAEFAHYAIWNESKIAKVLLPILSIKLIYSCWRDYKSNNGIYETDGKLLAWLILMSTNMPMTKKICFGILKKKFGSSWLKALFEIKFPWSDHPVRIALEGH